MTTPEPTPGLPDATIRPWLDLLRAARDDAGRREAQRYYFDHLLPLVLGRIDGLDAHRELRAEGYDTLISLMGFSPETTVICAAVVRPKRLVVVCGEGDAEAGSVADSFETAAEFLIRHKVLTIGQIERRVISPTDPVDIYEVIRTTLDRTPTVNDNRSALVDVTGGKKVMSATAGQAAWEVRVPLCYVEGRYDATLRRPRPGTEVVMQLLNPSTQERIQMRIAALRLFANRNYPLAVEAFETSRANRVENRLDDLAAGLSRAYVRWTDLDLDRLGEDVRAVRARLAEPRTRLLFKDRKQPVEPFLAHLDALAKVATADPLARIATYQELAELYRSEAFQRYDFACLLVYRGMEAVVEYGLKAAAARRGREFDTESPDYAALTDDPPALAARYASLAARADDVNRRKARAGPAEAELPPKLGFVNGLVVLCLTAGVHRAIGPAPADADADERAAAVLINQMREAAKRRNQSILAHGTRTLTLKDYDFMVGRADELTAVVLGPRAEDLRRLRENLRPKDLTPLHNPNEP